MPQLLPVNFTAQQIADSPDFPAATKAPEAPKGPDLRDGGQENYVLSESLAAKLGFSLGDISSSIKHQVLVFGASRWKDIQADGHTFRFGAAIRAVIVVTDASVDLDLTPAIVAANVQLGRATASATMEVRGYKGALRLPRWESFDVESHAKYQECVSDLQDKLLGVDADLDPELLATTAAASAIPAVAPSIGLLYALSMISHREPLLHALEHLHSEDDDVIRTVRSVYVARVGSNERGEPDEGQAEGARADLGEYQLNRGLFHRH